MWNRRLFRRFARKTFGNTDFEQIKGVLPHAGLPVCFGNYRADPTDDASRKTLETQGMGIGSEVRRAER